MAVVCRWKNPETFGQKSGLTAEVSLTPTERTTVQRQMTGARQGPPRCSMIDSLPPVEYTVYLGDTNGDIWKIDVPDSTCLGFRMDGQPYQSAELSSTMRMVTGPQLETS